MLTDFYINFFNFLCAQQSSDFDTWQIVGESLNEICLSLSKREFH